MAKLLVIDDSRFSRKRLIECLKQGKHEIIEAENGIKGFELAQHHQPDCILCDLLIPEMDGYQFLEKLRENDINIPVIVVTANIQETARKRAFDLGAIEVLNKSLSSSSGLLETVSAVIENRR